MDEHESILELWQEIEHLREGVDEDDGDVTLPEARPDNKPVKRGPGRPKKSSPRPKKSDPQDEDNK